MVKGVGGSTADQELKKIEDMTAGVAAISKDEFAGRIKKAAQLMQENDIQALYLNAGTNLYYFSGLRWSLSERMGGAILYQDGHLDFIAPNFEIGTFKQLMLIEGDILGWQEHQSPYQLFDEVLKRRGITSGNIGMDESAPFFLTDGLRNANPTLQFVNADSVIAECRMCKSQAEIAIIRRAKDITMAVQRAAARIMRPDISAAEVTDFIDAAHVKAGIPSGSYFCIVLFSDDTQFPHGVPRPQNLKQNDMVLVDTGCKLHGYISDITRSYVYGQPSERHRQIWDLEKAAQAAAFEAAQIGSPCSAVDDAARAVIKAGGLGPDYQIPGLPHRTGHGTGLDIHEHPYMVRGNDRLLKTGMVASIEPMICVPGEFGIRLEDHFYMTDSGAKWFTEPMKSIDEPFAQVNSAVRNL